MKPRCEEHNKPLRYVRRWRVWICKPCFEARGWLSVSREYPAPVRMKRRAQRIIFADGREVLRGKMWRARRTEVWFRAGFRCQHCGKTLVFEKAEIHHRRPRGIFGWRRDDRIENLECLCHACHRKTVPI
jgi:5-methylcytosine-specific restriction endonuclease McrA